MEKNILPDLTLQEKLDRTLAYTALIPISTQTDSIYRFNDSQFSLTNNLSTNSNGGIIYNNRMIGNPFVNNNHNYTQNSMIPINNPFNRNSNLITNNSNINTNS